MTVKNIVDALKPALLMVVVQIAHAAGNVLYKVAVNDGMSLRVVVAYRYVFATAFIAPLALILERKKRPKMTWRILFQAFQCGLFGGALPQNLNLEALALTTVTFTTAMANLIPAMTFVIALSFGLERLNLRAAAGKAKIIGTITGIGGAMVLTFYKGSEIEIGSLHVKLWNPQNGNVAGPHAISSGRTILGALFAFASNLSYALWLIIQAKMSETYPSPYSSTALMSLTGALLSIVFALCLEKDWSQWRLGWNVRLLTVAYSGIVVSGVMVAVISWCVHVRGPLFVSVFSPLMLVIVAVAGSTMLDEELHLGSIIGAVLIVCGLYMVLWGKSKEVEKKKNLPVPHELDTVQIIVRPPVEDKSNHNDNNSPDNAPNVVQHHEDWPENGLEEQDTHTQNKGKEGGEEQVLSRNATPATSMDRDSNCR